MVFPLPPLIHVQKIVVALLLCVFLIPVESCNAQNQHISEQNKLSVNNTIVGVPVNDIGNDICCIIQDNKGDYWFASNGEGVYHYDGKTLLHITVHDGLVSNYVLSIQKDSSGQLWFTTRDGFCSFDGHTFTDRTVQITKAPKAPLQYKKGGLFFAHKDGICFYNGTTFSNVVIHPSTYIQPHNTMMNPYSVYSILVDKGGDILFGTESKGVCVYNNRGIFYITEHKLDKAAIRTMLQTKNGLMWFGNNGGGLYRYNGITLSNITDEYGLDNPEFLKKLDTGKSGSLARVWSLQEDNKGNLWIGTIDAGVWKFDGSQLTHYTMNDGLTGNSIWALYYDTHQTLWCITNGNALCTFNGKTFEKFSFKQNKQ